MPVSHRASLRPVATSLVLVGLVLASCWFPGSPAGAAVSPDCLDVLATPDTGVNAAYGMAIDPVDGLIYVAVDGAGRVDVISPTTHTIVDSITVAGVTFGSVGFLAIDHPGDTLYVSSFSSSKVFAIDISTEAPITSIAVTDPQSLAINLSTHRLYVAGQSNDVVIINTDTNTAVGTLPVGGHSLGLAVDNGNNRIFVGDFTNGTLDFFDGGTKALIDSVDLPGDDPVTVRYDNIAHTAWVTVRDPGDVVEIIPETGDTGTSFALPDAQGLDINPTLLQGYATPSGGTTLTVFSLVDGSVQDTFPVGLEPLVVDSRVGPVRIYASNFDDGTIKVIGDDGVGPFADVAGANAFCYDIEWLVGEGITTGYSDDTYRPPVSVSRQAMAAFLYRYAGEPAFVPPVTPTFNDVPTTHQFFKEIEWLDDMDIAGGFPDGGFHPGADVTRQAMAAFMYRLLLSPVFVPPVTPTFGDVSTTHPFYKEIEWLASEHVASGNFFGNFLGSQAVSRQAMAAFLHRLSNVVV